MSHGEIQKWYKNSPRGESVSYTQLFQEIFCVDEWINDSILEKQRRYFGFTLFILHSKTIADAMRLGIENGRIMKKSTLPSLVRFLLKISGIFFQILAITFLLLLIRFNPPLYETITDFWWSIFLAYFVFLVGFMFIPDYKIVHDKMILLYKTQVFFNFSLYEAERMNTVFLEKIPELDTWESYVNNRESKCLQSAKNIIYMLYLVFRYLIIFSIYGIALLFMAMNWIDVGFQAIIYGFCCIVLLYIVMFPDIFGTFVLTRFYQIYFFLLNKHSDLFSWEVQMRDYFLDMYVWGNKLIASVQMLEKSVQEFKNGTINPKMWVQLTQVLVQLTQLWEIVEERKYFLEWKTQFQSFLLYLFNEIIRNYANSYDFLEEKIRSLELGIEYANIDEEERKMLREYMNPILQKNKTQIIEFKEMILNKEIALKESI